MQVQKCDQIRWKTIFTWQQVYPSILGPQVHRVEQLITVTADLLRKLYKLFYVFHMSYSIELIYLRREENHFTFLLFL